MFISTSMYFFMLFLIFWSYCGYLILMAVAYTLAERKNPPIPPDASLPDIALLVPCYNEEGLAASKIANIRRISYPENKLNVYFLNGLSTDGTSAKIRESIAGLSNFHLVETGVKGKINQVNSWLSGQEEKPQLIAVTDMDTEIEPDVLRAFAAEFAADGRIGVVGANISPADCMNIEKSYWLDQNTIRVLESGVYTASIVVAPCFAFRRELLPSFPEDCVADDIYISFKANTEGYITRYLPSAHGYELRAPVSLEQYFRHKFRKGNAYLTELFRFLYRLPQMSGWWKVVYITKMLQVAVMPWVLPYFLIGTVSLWLSGGGYRNMSIFGVVALFVSLLITHFVMKNARKTYLNAVSSKRSTLAFFFINNLILVIVGLSYPFYRQTSCYSRLAPGAGSK